jgi:hypothetical protein
MSFSLTCNYFICAVCKHTATDAVDSATGVMCASCGPPGLPPSYFVRNYMSGNSGSCECGWEGILAIKGLHEHTDCPNRKIACTGCSISFPLSALQDHLDTCPQVVTCCDICHFEGERQLLPTHTRTCVFGCYEKFPCSETRAHGISCMDIHDNVHRILLHEHTLLKKQRIDEQLVESPTFTPQLYTPASICSPLPAAPAKQLRVNYSFEYYLDFLAENADEDQRREILKKVLQKLNHARYGLKKNESPLNIAVAIQAILIKDDNESETTTLCLQIFSKCYDCANDRKCKKQLNDFSAFQLLPRIGNLNEIVLRDARLLFCQIAEKIISQSTFVVKKLTASVASVRTANSIAESSADIKTGLQILLKLAEQHPRIINKADFFESLDSLLDDHNSELITDNFSVLAGIVKRCTSFELCLDLVNYLAKINPRTFKKVGLVDHLVYVTEKNKDASRDAKFNAKRILLGVKNRL